MQKSLEVKEGIIQGLAKVFDSDGFMVKEYNLIKDSIKNGPYTEFYHDGAIMTKANFKNDTLNGIMYFFSEKGDTTKYYYRNRGDIAMPYKKWLDNGIILTGDYIDNREKAVIWKWYTREGKLIKKKIQYVNNGEFPVPE